MSILYGKRRSICFISFQVQAKHWACTQWRSGVSCVCGVAMRENDTILIADMCLNESAIADDPKYITYNGKDLPDDAGIKVSDSGRTFKVTDMMSLIIRKICAIDGVQTLMDLQ